MKRLACFLSIVSVTLLGVHLSASLSVAQDAPRDKRLGPPKTLNAYFPWTPPESKASWNTRRKELREQVLVASGLWPMPEKTPLKAVVHGKIKRDGYTVEKVFFASYPGHYVTGNLYRPTAKAKGTRPGILCPHGHWANGRFYENSDAAAKGQLKQGAEQTMAGAKYPLQARCAQLARMGCVVFHYDMVGYADSKQIPHRAGFVDPEAELRLQSFMGLQTYNSIRALDFLTSLPDVDPKRIGVTGASGGGTQTFMLCAVDDRPAVAVPAVMVSTSMQGGCICENCSYLRVGSGNIELAALWAPKPLGLIGADDWTVEIETKGYPQLQQLYDMLGKKDLVKAKAFTQFKHNYNQVSREFMYNFMNRHLQLGLKEPIKEQPFEPIPPKDLSVFDAQHPLPKAAVNAAGLRRHLTMESDKQLAKLTPTNKKTLGEYREVFGPALQAMIADSLPAEPINATKPQIAQGNNGMTTKSFYLSRMGAGEAVSALWIQGKEFNGRVVIWVHPDGVKSADSKELTTAVQEILASKAAILAVEPFRTGATADLKRPAVDTKYAGYTFGYNRPLLAERVHDILTAIAYARQQKGTKTIDLIGFEEAGPWTMLARGLAGNAVRRTAADVNNFRFEQILSNQDDMMLPGALKYGGLLTLAGLSAPHELMLYNTRDAGPTSTLQAAYQSAGAAKNLHLSPAAQDAAAVTQWLNR